jgi:ABC-2 type transport system permease protein
MTVGSGSIPTAVAVCTDMTEGIVARFRTMAISRASILSGHVVGSMIQTMVSVGLVIGVSLLMGFRPTADPVRWIAAIIVLALLALAPTWLAVALGLVTKTARGSQQRGTAFVPPAIHQQCVRPFGHDAQGGPLVRSLPALHADHRHPEGTAHGSPIGSSAVIALAWCVGIALAGYLWARTVFNRGPAH